MYKVLIISIACAIASCTHSPSAPPDQPAAASSTRIGTYDSRAVAMAFSRSPGFKQWLGDLHSEHDKAKAAGDTKRAAELEKQGRDQQERLHVQVFSTGAIEDVLAHLQTDLPKIREKAGVTELISQWDKDALAAHANAERVDVTMDMVNAFNPTEKDLEAIRELQKHKPVSKRAAMSD